jgi:hypothetical protein
MLNLSARNAGDLEEADDDDDDEQVEEETEEVQGKVGKRKRAAVAGKKSIIVKVIL